MGRQSGAMREQRLFGILEIVTKLGSTTVEELAHELDVSMMTMYRDVATLEATGLIHRSHGKVSSAPFAMAEASSLLRVGTEVPAKKRIARAAIKLLKPGSSVAIDDSTTCLYLFPGLDALAPMTVITNARFMADEVLKYPDLDLIQLGGAYVKWADAFCGPQTEAQIDSLNPDYCLMSTTAVNDGMCCHPDAAMASLKGRLMRSARTKILLMDHTKIARAALHRFLPLDEVDVLITEKSLPASTLEEFRQKVGEVITV